MGPIRISTIAGAIAIFGLVWLIKRDPIRGIVAVAAWLSLFETLYHVVGIVGFHWPLANFAWQTAALVGWIALAAVIDIWPEWRVTIAFVAVMGVWIATGFHSNAPSHLTAVNTWDEMLNVAAKSLLGLAYLLGALRLSNPYKKIHLGEG